MSARDVWGRGRRSGLGGAAQDRAILSWLKRGYFEVNARLVEQKATISHTNFWKKVRMLLPPPPAKSRAN